MSIRGNRIKRFFDKVVIFLTKNEEEIKLERLFDRHIERFEDFGFPGHIIERIKEDKRRVVIYSLYHVFGPRCLEALHFCPIIPKYIWAEAFNSPLFKVNFRAMFKIDQEEFLRIFEDDIDSSEVTPYFIFNFEPGSNRYVKGLNFETAENLFQKVKVFPLTFEQIMSTLIIYPEMYKDGEKIVILPNKRKTKNFIYWFEGSFKLGEWNNVDIEEVPEAAFPVYWKRKFFVKK
ncbi:MAG: hypothetical protein WC280_01125 [Patescibacteria group bacterium]